jgi:hypothetical protein
MAGHHSSTASGTPPVGPPRPRPGLTSRRPLGRSWGRRKGGGTPRPTSSAVYVAVRRRPSRRIRPPRHGASGADPTTLDPRLWGEITPLQSIGSAAPDPPTSACAGERNVVDLKEQGATAGSSGVHLPRLGAWADASHSWELGPPPSWLGARTPTAATGSSGACHLPAWGRETLRTWRNRAPVAGSSCGRLPRSGARVGRGGASSPWGREKREGHNA